MIIETWETPDEVFARIREMAHTSEGASALVSFCKAFDLRSPECAEIVREISSWISSPHEQFRQEVMFSLCFFRPVPGYEWVVIEGWKRAPTADLNWYPGGIECAFKTTAQLTPEMVGAIAARLDRATPADDLCDGDPYDHDGTLWARELELDETSRALAHFAQLVGVDHPARRAQHAVAGSPSGAELNALAEAWRAVVARIVEALKSHT